VVPHTFGAHLNFNTHLHILISTLGLYKTGSTLVPNVWFPRDAVVKKWLHTLLDYLKMALEASQLSSELSRPELLKLLHDRDHWWSARVDYYKFKNTFLRYIARYLRRPPLVEYRLLHNGGRESVFDQ
jgi:hypothetical protein